MAQTIRLGDVIKGPMRYWTQDGLPDLVLGILMAYAGGVFLVAFAIPRDSSIGQVYSIAAPVLWGAGTWLVLKWGMAKLRARIAKPPDADAAPAEGTQYRLTSVGIATFVVALAIAGLAIGGVGVLVAKGGGQVLERISGPAAALIFALVLLQGWTRWKLAHMLVLAGVSVLLGVWMYWIKTGFEGVLWVMLTLGGAMAVTGAVRLQGFVKKGPKLAGTEHE